MAPKPAAPELGHGMSVHNGRDSKKTKEDVIGGDKKGKRSKGPDRHVI